MPRSKKLLTPQSQWTLILIGALCYVYVGFNWHDFLPVKKVINNYGTVSAVIIQAGSQMLEIPTLGISAPVIYSNSTQESKIQTELESGVVHLAGTADIGSAGNPFIVGHSSNYKNAPGNFNDVFKNLPNIKNGDTIRITDGKNSFTYTVTGTQIVMPTELWVESQATDGAKLLTLQTSYPVGTAKKRFIVFAKLVE